MGALRRVVEGYGGLLLLSAVGIVGDGLGLQRHLPKQPRCLQPGRMKTEPRRLPQESSGPMPEAPPPDQDVRRARRMPAFKAVKAARL